MVSTFQLTRSGRLSLTNQKITKDTKNSRRGSAMASRRHPTRWRQPPREIRTTMAFADSHCRGKKAQLSSSWPS